MTTEEVNVGLFNHNKRLQEAIRGLLEMYDDFKDGDEISHEEAYHSFYKGQYDKWEYARKSLTSE